MILEEFDQDMAEEELKAEVTVAEAPPGTEPFIPAEVKKIVVELEKIPEEVIEKGVEIFWPETGKYVPAPYVAPVKKSMVLDMETTGALPWDSRIICIGVKDAALFDQPPTVFFDEDEKVMVEQFLAWFTAGGFDEIIGYNVSFDFRFIFSRCMFYQIQAPDFFAADLYDMMNVMKQVKRVFVFGFNKTGSLEDWMKYLWDETKAMTIDEIMAAYTRREYEPILDYCKQDVEYIFTLWLLTQYVLAQV